MCLSPEQHLGKKRILSTFFSASLSVHMLGLYGVQTTDVRWKRPMASPLLNKEPQVLLLENPVCNSCFRTRVQIHVLLPQSCVAAGQLCNLSEPQLCFLQHRVVMGLTAASASQVPAQRRFAGTGVAPPAVVILSPPKPGFRPRDPTPAPLTPWLLLCHLLLLSLDSGSLSFEKPTLTKEIEQGNLPLNV